MGTLLNFILEVCRGVLFFAALVNGLLFMREGQAAFPMICFYLKLGHVRKSQLVGLASMGWTLVALGATILMGFRMTQNALHYKVPTTAEVIGLGTAYTVFTTGFYWPVLALFWWRGRLKLGLLIGAMIVLGGIGLAIAGSWLAFPKVHMPDQF